MHAGTGLERGDGYLSIISVAEKALPKSKEPLVEVSQQKREGCLGHDIIRGIVDIKV